MWSHTTSYYYYYALNRRVARDVPGRLELFVYDADRVVMELYDPDGMGTPATTIAARSTGYGADNDAPHLLAGDDVSTCRCRPATSALLSRHK